MVNGVRNDPVNIQFLTGFLTTLEASSPQILDFKTTLEVSSPQILSELPGSFLV